MMMLWWCVAMIINAFERQQEIKELYQDDAYTILHIIHEKTFTVVYKNGPAHSPYISIVLYRVTLVLDPVSALHARTTTPRARA